MPSSPARLLAFPVRYLLLSEFLDLFLEAGTSDFQTSLLLLGIIDHFPGFLQLHLVHGLDGGGFLSPSLLQLVQLIGEFPVLCLQEANLLDVCGESFVQVLHILLFPISSLLDAADTSGGDIGVGSSVGHRKGGIYLRCGHPLHLLLSTRHATTTGDQGGPGVDLRPVGTASFILGLVGGLVGGDLAGDSWTLAGSLAGYLG